MVRNLWRVLRATDASVRKWRQRRKMLRVLAGLDERQLRDVGLTHSKALPALAGREGNQSTGETK